jgi:uncharacterized Zn-finger protein
MAMKREASDDLECDSDAVIPKFDLIDFICNDENVQPGNACPVVIGRNQCEICGKTLASSDGKRKHIQSVHEKIKFKCPQCNKNYSRKDVLTGHMKRFHGAKNALTDSDQRSNRT